jgi:hypothetical protein
VAAFWGLVYTGLVVSTQVRTTNDPSAAVAFVHAEIPPGEQLVSFRPVHHLFAYYYRQPIELCSIPDRRAPRDFAGTYFCFAEDPSMPKLEIPFDWQPIAEISCERGQTTKPLTKVTVGKRIARSSGVRHAAFLDETSKSR